MDPLELNKEFDEESAVYSSEEEEEEFQFEFNDSLPLKRKQPDEEHEEDDEDEDDEELEDEIEEANDDESNDKVTTQKTYEEEDKIKTKSLKKKYFTAPPVQESKDSFHELCLSRPILKAITLLGYTKPTPIQQQAIPLALQAKDLCASAITGSGKTAAFMIPILERLLFRPKTVAVTRVLVLVPTRELATQVYDVTCGLSKFSSVGVCLCVGGMSNKQQEQELQLKPDIVIATPGRLIDHIHNSKSFTLDHIEVLVIDEADRILQQGFEKELDEIIRFLPKRRQSMLFSATMTDSIDQLIKLSLKEPIRLFVDSSTKLTSKLVQEFVKVRQVREETRPAILIALCSRTYKKECIIFFRSKKATHYMRVLFQLFGLKAAELHGDLTQPQRTENLNLFKSKKVDFLLCTDVASRGLDIPEVKTVINYDMPATYEVYVHRCGRTARGTKGGRAVGLVGENDRVLMKMALKNSSEDVKNRVIPSKIILEYEQKVESLKPDLEKKFEDEKIEKEFERVEMELKKAENRIVHAKEIESRPARVWFQTEAEKLEQKKNKSGNPQTKVKEISRSKLDGMSRKKKRLYYARKEDAEGAAKQKIAAKHAKVFNKIEKIGKLNGNPRLDKKGVPKIKPKGKSGKNFDKESR